MSRTLVLSVVLIFLFTSTSPTSILLDAPQVESAGEGDSVIISEILVSPNGLKNNETCTNCYNATDWNGDGDYGKFSDQFIELHNPTSEAINVSDWVLDDKPDGGSAPCQLARNTVIPANGYISVFINASRIELDYFDGDSVSLTDTDGTLIDEMTYPGEDSWYGNSYITLENGSVWKVSPPTPGFAEGESFPAAQNMVGCFGISDGGRVDAMVLQGRVVTMNAESDVINEGNVLIRGGKIEAVWGDQIPANVDLTNVPIIDTNGSIYPGLIDSHNHMHYNHIPLWDFDVHTSTKSEEGGYSNRNQWKNNPNYKRDISWMKTFVQGGSMWNMADEQMKYAEVMAVAGGVTAVQGSPSSNTDAWDSMLSRNIELYNFGCCDDIHTKVTTLEGDYVGSHIKNGNNSGQLNAWYLHLSEGVDEVSRAEFDVLVQNDLLVGELVVVHGTALTSTEFAMMGQVGADLAWSPLSNLLLYGDTTDVVAADQAGVRISLAPDWGPSGSKNVLHELKVADVWNKQALDGYFSDYELAAMTTKNPAMAKVLKDLGFTVKKWPGFYTYLILSINTIRRLFSMLIRFEFKRIWQQGKGIHKYDMYVIEEN